MNKKENCQNSSEREQHIEVKRTVNQKSTSQKKVNQKSTSQKKANQKGMSQKKANQSGEKSVYDGTGMPFRKESKRSNGRKSNVMACSTVMTKKNRKSSIRL